MRINEFNQVRDYISISPAGRQKMMELKRQNEIKPLKTQEALPIQKKDDPETRKLEVEKAARDFEALFVGQMLKTMQETVPENELFGGGDAEKVFREMFLDEVGKDVAKHDSLGLAKSIVQQIERLESKKVDPASIPKTPRISIKA